MSEPELYMPDTNESFDLPRWQTHIEPLSSSAQAAHAAQASYLYPGPPPPPPTNNIAASQHRLQPIHHSPTNATRQHRISQILEQDQQQGLQSSQYLSGGHSQLARSTSLGGAVAQNISPAARARRHHQPDDLEGAFTTDKPTMAGPRQQPQITTNSFYPNVAYQSQSLTGSGAGPNSVVSPTIESPYSDMYYNGNAPHPPPAKRMQSHDASAARAGRSPLRVPVTPTSNSLLDPYTQQAQYSPTTASYSYAPPQAFHTHSRSQSQVKPETASPALAPYTSQPVLPGSYQSPYAMDTSSPHPSSQSQTHLVAHAASRQNSSSNPPTPLSYMPSSQASGAHYYPQDQAMSIDVPPPKRRASGFRRVRNVHDLQPRTDIPTTGRRMGSDGAYLSVGITGITIYQHY